MFVWEQDTHLLLTGGAEKILRIYDLNRPDAPPKEVDKSPGSVRSVAWLHSDQTILSSYTDMGGVRCSLFSHMMPIVVYFCDFCYINKKLVCNFVLNLVDNAQAMGCKNW
jgi:WD40 repeat protein